MCFDVLMGLIQLTIFSNFVLEKSQIRSNNLVALAFMPMRETVMNRPRFTI